MSDSSKPHGMKLRSSTRFKTSWTYLPVEIRLMILEEIAHGKYPGWGPLASVCREWQAVLEKENYRKLKIRASCLDDFDSMVPPQKRELVHHIWLDVELPRYMSFCCSRDNSSPANSRIVTDAVWKLFSILSNWIPGNKLTLELNAFCPSDSEHWFKNLYFSSDHVEDVEDTSALYTADYPYHDPNHGWIHGQQVGLPPNSDILRIFRPIQLLFRETLPRVEAVTCLIIRRQLRRCITPVGLARLITKLERLEQIHYEPWLSFELGSEFDKPCIALILGNYLPDTFNRLVIFEDSHKFYDALPSGAFQAYSLDLRDSYGDGIDTAFAVKSLDLQHLAVSFMVNAEEVFQNCLPTWSWPRLQSLSLTSQLLQNDWEKRDAIEALLCRAGGLAQKMPRIQSFVLWNGGKAHACAFIYRVNRDHASITWRGTWRLQMSPCVVESWKRAASNVSYNALQIKQELIEETIRSHGDAIYHLKLPCQVINPASLWQIRREVGGSMQ